jgi:hypothetical protein
MDAYKGFVEFTELTSIGITREETGRIKNGRGAYIHVKKGTVWITHDGCDKDVVLGPGASYYIKRDGLTLISPLQGTRLPRTSRIVRPASGRPRSLARW